MGKSLIYMYIYNIVYLVYLVPPPLPSDLPRATPIRVCRLYRTKLTKWTNFKISRDAAKFVANGLNRTKFLGGTLFPNIEGRPACFPGRQPQRVPGGQGGPELTSGGRQMGGRGVRATPIARSGFNGSGGLPVGFLE